MVTVLGTERKECEHVRAIRVIPFTVRVPRVDDTVTSSTRPAIVRIPTQLRADGGGIDTFFHAWDTGVVARKAAVCMADAFLAKGFVVLLFELIVY